MGTTVIEQTPAEKLDWEIDWSTRGLGADTIASSSFQGSSSDITLSDLSNTATTATFWLTGGFPGTTYYITNTIVTSGGRTMAETIPFVCIPKRMI